MLTSFFEGRYGGYLALKDNEFRDAVLRREKDILSLGGASTAKEDPYRQALDPKKKKKRIVMGLYSTYFVDE